jgi:IMP dehydrogenase/GMP reductase
MSANQKKKDKQKGKGKGAPKQKFEKVEKVEKVENKKHRKSDADKKDEKKVVESKKEVKAKDATPIPKTMEELKQALKGKVLTKDDGEEFEKHRNLWDPTQHPTYLVVPQDQSDVGVAMKYCQNADIILWAKRMPLITTSPTMGVAPFA